MAITNAQQAKQILMEDGGIPQLVKKGKGKKRPGYRGDAAARSSGAAASGRVGGSDVGESSTRSDPRDSGPDDRGTRQQNLNQQRIRNEAAARNRERARQRQEEIRRTAAQKSLAADAKRVADRKKRQKDLSFLENYLGPEGFTRRTKAANLKSLGALDKKYGTIFGMPTGIVGGVAEAFDVPEETAMFDIDSIREIAGPLSTMAGKKGLSRQQSKDLKDLRQDMEIEQKILDGTLTNKEFLEYRDRNKPPPRPDDAGPQPIIPIIAQTPESQKKEEEEDPFQLALAFRADGGRVPYADGGIMDLEEARRQLYFAGGLIKKAKRAVKKIVKSPIGKIGLGALAFKFGAPLLTGGGGFSGLAKKFGFDAIKNKIAGAGIGKLAGLSIGGGLLAGALAGKGYEDEDEDGFDDNTGFSVEEYRKRGAQGNVPIAFRAEGGMSDVENDPQYKGWKRIYEVNPDAAEMHPKHKEFVKYYANLDRDKKAEGGLMDLKGMEMDFRDEGGFVPIGKKERADDVPARLSKNEFVMTADAVRGAGDGNIDKGAEKMYNLMSKLEAENDQSQGLDGARKMFKTAQRLEEVL